MEEKKSSSEKHAYTSAFEGNSCFLLQRLDVTDLLLATLEDEHILFDEHVSTVNTALTQIRRASKLVGILKRCDSSTFPVFLKILDKFNQKEVVKRLCPAYYDTGSVQQASDRTAVEEERVKPDHEWQSHKLLNCSKVNKVDESLRHELKELIEPDYGFPDELLRTGVLTCDQLEEINDDLLKLNTVHKRACSLLEFLVKNLASKRSEPQDLLSILHDDSLLLALKGTQQVHVAKYITQRGKINLIEFEFRPLNRQQRNRMHPSPSLCAYSDLNSRDAVLLAMLASEGVLYGMHLEYIKDVNSDGDSDENVLKIESNKRLLSIMKRKSLYCAVQFLHCLCIAEQHTAVNVLLECGSFPEIHSKMNSEDLHAQEDWIVERINILLSKRDGLGSGEPDISESVEKLKNNNCFLIDTCKSDSIAWRILCRTTQSLECLRKMYINKDLEKIIQDIVTSVCGNEELISLRVEWSDDNYEYCKSYMEETLGLPFGLFESAPFAALPFVQLELILYKAYYTLYRGLVEFSSQNASTDTTLCTVCLLWWNVIAGTHQRRDRLRRLIRHWKQRFQVGDKMKVIDNKSDLQRFQKDRDQLSNQMTTMSACRTEAMTTTESASATRASSDDNDQGILVRFHDSLKINELELINVIDPSSGLWPLLNDMDVIDDWTIARCKAEKTVEDQVKALIEQLKKLSDSNKVLSFYRALELTHQESIVRKFSTAAGPSYADVNVPATSGHPRKRKSQEMLYWMKR